jgi:hypothetical protein
MEHLLAVIDRLIGYDHGSFDADGFTKNFYSYPGGLNVPTAIVDRNGHIQAIGGAGWIVHRYDRMGELISRIPMYKALGQGECLVYGWEKINEIRNKHARCVGR